MKKPITIHFITPERKSLKNLWRKLFIALFSIFLLSGIGQFVQAQQIINVEEAVSEMLASDNPETFSQGMHLQSLLVNVHPALYINNGAFSPHGTSDPIVLYSDASSIQSLYDTHPLFSQVELIKISIENNLEIPDAVLLEQMTGFPNLQYVYVLFEYDACRSGNSSCLADILSQIFAGAKSPVVLLYGKSIPQ